MFVTIYVSQFVHSLFLIFYFFVHIQLAAMPDGNASSQNGHSLIENSGIQVRHYSPLSQVIQIGAGHGGEGAEDRHGPPIRRRTTGSEGMQQGWRNPSGKFNLIAYYKPQHPFDFLCHLQVPPCNNILVNFIKLL